MNMTMLRLSNVCLKNIVVSKVFLIGCMTCIVYSLLWILVVSPSSFLLVDYMEEVERLIVIFAIYASSLVLQNDITSNVTKVLFTGTLTRTQVMLSKLLTLIGLGLVFFMLAKLIYVIMYLFKFRSISVSEFWSGIGWEDAAFYVVAILWFGCLFLLLVSLLYRFQKVILYIMLFLILVQYLNAMIVAFVARGAGTLDLPTLLLVYTKLPLYLSSEIALMGPSLQNVTLLIGYGAVCFLLAVLVIRRREIK